MNALSAVALGSMLLSTVKPFDELDDTVAISRVWDCGTFSLYHLLRLERQAVS